ncbi:MAG: hypothetical protein ACI9SC_002661 [Gammaproteobacteria bacterium]
MGLLIFQIIIRQWDKSQLTPRHIATRASLPDRYLIVAKPVFQVSDRDCIIDQHGDDLANSIFKDGRIKYTKPSDEQISVDRFQVSTGAERDILTYLVKDKPPVTIGAFDEGWIQCRYNWRYGVEESNEFYWMYEEVTLNAACTEDFDAEYFLKSEPVIIFKDQ